MRLQRYTDFVLESNRYDVLFHGSPHEFSKFDMSRVGTGDGLSKYGYGLYFSTKRSAAAYYARENSIGALRDKGFNIYDVFIAGQAYFYPWEVSMPYDVYEQVLERLKNKGFKKERKQLKEENDPDSGYELFTMDDIYSWLTHVLGSKKATTEFLYACGVYGVTVPDGVHGGTIYVAFSDSIIKILDRDRSPD